MRWLAKLVQRLLRVLYPCYGPELFCGGAMRHAPRPDGRIGIDFGAGDYPLPDATPIDRDTATRLADIPDGSQDYVFSSHALEHIYAWRKVLAEFWRVLKPGGELVLYLPHEDMALWNPERWMGRLSEHVWQPRLETLYGYAALNGWQVRDYDAGPDAYHSWFIVMGKPK